MLSRIVLAEGLQYWMTFTMDGRVLAVLIAVTAGSALVFGLAPALHLLRIDVNQTIKDAGRMGISGVPARRWTTAFLAIEFALTLVLLALNVAGLRQQRASELAVASVMPRVDGAAMHFEIAGQPRTPDGAAEMALGSRPRGVAWIVLRRALSQLAVGLVVGLGCTYAFDRIFTETDDAIRLIDAHALIPLMAAIAIVAIGACVMPVRRAMRIDPVVALRAQ